jgi:hypothetical protein
MYTIKLVRKLKERTSDERLKNMVRGIADYLKGKNAAKNWEISIASSVKVEFSGGIYSYTGTIRLTQKSGHESKREKQARVLGELLLKHCGSKFGNYPWEVDPESEHSFLNELKTEILSESLETPDLKSLPSIPERLPNLKVDVSDHFSHIYGREHQLKIVLSAIEAGIASDWENRFHAVLFGAPACGKSDILSSVGKMLGKEGEAYLKLDATSTTQAGAQKLFLRGGHVPPVLIIEEIEKTEEKALRWLLGLLDHRAEIRKMTARENETRSLKLLCLATVNDIDLFRKTMHGALASRFSHQIYCPRPDRNILKMILTREVENHGGDLAWIEPALKYCVDENGWNDPRKIIPVCLCGREGLLDGSYQESLKATEMPSEKKTRLKFKIAK